MIAGVLRRMHLDHHALEARAFLRVGVQPVEQLITLQRLERDATCQRARQACSRSRSLYSVRQFAEVRIGSFGAS